MFPLLSLGSIVFYVFLNMFRNLVFSVFNSSPPQLAHPPIRWPLCHVGDPALTRSLILPRPPTDHPASNAFSVLAVHLEQWSNISQVLWQFPIGRRFYANVSKCSSVVSRNHLIPRRTHSKTQLFTSNTSVKPMSHVWIREARAVPYGTPSMAWGTLRAILYTSHTALYCHLTG